MQFAIVLAVMGLVVAAVVIGGLVLMTRRLQEREQGIDELGADRKLVHEVLPGQDPAAVVVALEIEGYRAVTRGTQVVVACPDGAEKERERVREAIAFAPLNFEGDLAPTHDVRFIDEPTGTDA